MILKITFQIKKYHAFVHSFLKDAKVKLLVETKGNISV